MTKPFDRIVFGKNIRMIRKKKKITLGDLAKGICSIGKMSNIENGLTEIDDETIILLANKLDVTPQSLLVAETEAEQSIRALLEDVEEMRAFGLNHDALKLLDRINQNHVNVLQGSTTLQTSMLYIEGIVFKQLHNEYNATTRFYQVLELPFTTQEDIITHAKALHNLGELYAKSSHYFQSIEHLEKAVDVLQAHNLSVPWRIYYNLAVLNMYQRQYERASVYLTFIHHRNPRLEYVNALIYLLSENYKEGMERLYKTRKGLLELEDREMLLRSIIATLYFSSFSPTNYQEKIANTIYYIENELTTLQYTETIQIEKMVITIQSIVSTDLKMKNFTRVAKYLKILTEFEENHEFFKHRYISLLLRGLFIKETEPENTDLRKSLLDLSLDLMTSNNVQNIHQFTIMYERTLLAEDEEDTIAYKALMNLKNYFHIDSVEIIQYEHFMPTILPL